MRPEPESHKGLELTLPCLPYPPDHQLLVLARFTSWRVLVKLCALDLLNMAGLGAKPPSLYRQHSNWRKHKPLQLMKIYTGHQHPLFRTKARRQLILNLPTDQSRKERKDVCGCKGSVLTKTETQSAAQPCLEEKAWLQGRKWREGDDKGQTTDCKSTWPQSLITNTHTRMHTHKHIWTHMRMHLYDTYMNTCRGTHVHAVSQVHMNTCAHTFTYTHNAYKYVAHLHNLKRFQRKTCVSIHVHVCVYICIYEYVCTHMYVCTYIYLFNKRFPYGPLHPATFAIF